MVFQEIIKYVIVIYELYEVFSLNQLFYAKNLWSNVMLLIPLSTLYTLYVQWFTDTY